MASPSHCSLLALLLLTFLSACTLASCATDGSKRLHVVYMGEKKHHDGPEVVTALHHDTLASILGSKEAAQQEIVYSYKHGFSGFAAMLTNSQAKRVSNLPGVRRVSPSYPLRRHTTGSWDFLHLSDKEPSSLLSRSNFGEGVIVGVIDTGIWPESKSFDDEGYGPIPKRWKGTCQEGEAFNSSHCNLKIIGARYYTGGLNKSAIKEIDYLSPRGKDGHGTHVASTIAGSYIKNASIDGLAAGTARGGAPRAMLAIYKVIYSNEKDDMGNDASLIAAIDDAIHDGVDVLSLSMRMSENSWATLNAVTKGITVVYSAGNSGPLPEVVENTSPWVITVAATTMDRSFPTAITLGNNHTVMGQAMFVPKSNIYDQFYGIAYLERCDAEALQKVNLTEIYGKYVLCDKGLEPSQQDLEESETALGAAKVIGMIFAQFPAGFLKLVDKPVVNVNYEVHQQMLEYIKGESFPTVKISNTRTVEGKKVLAPAVAFFSSRGPSVDFPGILKPDIAAPGVNILAAVEDSYKFMSGTSMSTPHVSAIVALIKAVRPNWSPAAIRSALITTAMTTDQRGVPIMAEGIPSKVADPFDYGGGLINPDKVIEPGMVYDIDPKDYRELHCNIEGRFLLLCQRQGRPVYHLNLPYVVIPDLKSELAIFRTVTNVGPTNSAYQVFVEPPPGVEIAVEPSTLVFNATVSRITYKVTIRARELVQGLYTFGSLTWNDGRHRVRIPIAIRVVIIDSFTYLG